MELTSAQVREIREAATVAAARVDTAREYLGALVDSLTRARAQRIFQAGIWTSAQLGSIDRLRGEIADYLAVLSRLPDAASLNSSQSAQIQGWAVSSAIEIAVSGLDTDPIGAAWKSVVESLEELPGRVGDATRFIASTAGDAAAAALDPLLPGGASATVLIALAILGVALVASL